MYDYDKLIENEKEWRRYIVKGIDDLRDRQDDMQGKLSEQGRDIARLKTWAWIARSFMITLFGGVFYYFESKFRGE